MVADVRDVLPVKPLVEKQDRKGKAPAVEVFQKIRFLIIKCSIM